MLTALLSAGLGLAGKPQAQAVQGGAMPEAKESALLPLDALQRGGGSKHFIKAKSNDEPACSDGFSKEYSGTHCVGDAEWEAANGNKACDCFGGVCKHCCKEDVEENGDWSCSWEEPNGVADPTFGYIADEACNVGFSRNYTGTHCVGDAAWEAANGDKACDCQDGVCQKCCKEEVGEDGSWACYWQDPDWEWMNSHSNEHEFVADDACEDGFSRTYHGTNCVGDAAWEAANGNKACDCADGTCKMCCKEETSEEGSWACSWAEPEISYEFVYDNKQPLP